MAKAYAVWHNKAHVERASRSRVAHTIPMHATIKRTSYGTFTASACYGARGRAGAKRCGHGNGRTPTTATRNALTDLVRVMQLEE